MIRFLSKLSAVLLMGVMGVFLTFSAAAQELPFTHYTSDHPYTPLPANGVTAVYQDEIGFLWIALSGAGIARYDGRSMEHFTMEDGLADPHADGFVQSADGHLWITTYGGLSVSQRPLHEYPSYEPVRFATTYCDTAVYDGSISDNAVVADSLDGVWVGTADQGVLRYRCTGGTAHVDTFRTTVEGTIEEVYALTLRRNGSLWASLSGGTMLRLADAHDADSEARFKVVLSEKVNATTTALFEDSQGVLWAGTYVGRSRR